MISLLLIAWGSLLLFLAYQYIIFPVLLSPLSKIPNAHFTSSFSPAWMLWKRKTHHENRAIFAAHERCGPVVRLAPNEISINCIEGGLRTVYGNFERHSWYTNTFQNYGYSPLVLPLIHHQNSLCVSTESPIWSAWAASSSTPSGNAWSPTSTQKPTSKPPRP